MSEIVPGQKVVEYLLSIGTAQGGFLDSTLRAVGQRDFTLMMLDVRDLEKTDPDFAEFAKEYKERDYEADGGLKARENDEEELEPDDHYASPIVIIDGEMRDGYSRAAAHLHRGEPMISAYVATEAQAESIELVAALLDGESPKDFMKRKKVKSSGTLAPVGDISEDDWLKYYKPIINPHNPDDEDDDDRPYNGTLFETFGPEMELVNAAARKNAKTVWTLIDAEGTQVVIPGRHFVNRIGYFITERPWVDQDTSVEMVGWDGDPD